MSARRVLGHFDMPAAVFWMMEALRRGHYAADDAISRLETQMAAADHQFPLVRPRASRAPLEFMASLACESDMNGYASLVMRLRDEL